ncbi:unnamed protein product [Alopecurus aequalis]
MTETSKQDGNKRTALAGGEDRIGALPDAVLEQILSFLPSRDAVRTCVLAARCRTLWKSVPSLRINTSCEGYRNAHALSKFVNHLLLLRDRTPLHECEINSYYTTYDTGDVDEAFRYIELWLRYVVSCQVRVLRVRITSRQRKDSCLTNLALLSQHLTRLELCSINAGGHFLDFSGCSALKVLKMEHCAINAQRISSPSLSHLTIHDGSFMSDGRTRISAPKLNSVSGGALFAGYTPLLEPMPSLVRVFLRFGETRDDQCDYSYYFGNCDSKPCGRCSYSYNKFHDNDDCVLLDDFSGLIYFVQHSPILERLTLQLKHSKEEFGTETDKSYNTRSQFLVSKHLKVVEIKCCEEDEIVHQIVKILGTHGVPSEHINIKPNFRNSGLRCFSFEQE